MRSIMMVLGLVIFNLSSIPLYSEDSEKVKISIKMWNRYTALMDGGELSKSEFALKRGYFRLEPYFTDNIKGRFNIDVFSSDDATYGAGVKLKYAYLDFQDLIPNNKLTVGLFKNHFGFGYDWDYITIEKTLEWEEGVISSSDYGVGLSGNMMEDNLEYAFSIANGEGYKSTGSNINLNPQYLFDSRIKINPRLTVGGSILFENVGFTPGSYIKRLSYTGIVHFEYKCLQIFGELLGSEYGSIGSSGYMIMPVFKLNKFLEKNVGLVARYDRWNPNTDVSDNSHSRLIGGINWLLNSSRSQKLFLQVFWENTIFEEEERDNENKFMVQLKWSHANIL